MPHVLYYLVVNGVGSKSPCMISYEASVTTRGAKRNTFSSACENAETRYGAPIWVCRTLVGYTSQNSLRTRPQSYCFAETNLPRNVWPRHVMGVLQCIRSHVLTKVSAKASRILGCCPELQARHGGTDACYESAQEGM